MSWKQLKSLAIAVLIVMDAVFLFLVLQRNYLATHYDRALADSAIEVYRQSELYVDRSILSDRIVSLPVYTGITESGRLRELPVVKKITEMGYKLTDEPGGIRCENAVGEFYFAEDFGFYYREKGRYDRPSDLLATERYILLTEERGYKESALRVVQNFLEKYNFLSADGTHYGYDISYSDVYSSGVNYIVTLSQSIEGIPVHGDICVMVSGGRVVSADGVFATEAPVNREKAETVDLLNIFFAEKAALDEAYRAGGSFSYTPHVVSSVSYSYAVYFDAERNFYLVPLCEVKYVGGERRVYNCVSGKLYSQK